MRKDERYNQRGVSASKEDVHNAIKNIDKGIFPKAFCKIIPDYLGGQKSYCNIMHADGTEQSLHLPICIGRKPEIYPCGKGSHKML